MRRLAVCLAALSAVALFATAAAAATPAQNSGWTIQATPNVGALSQLNAADAISPSDVWVVGESGAPFFNSLPLAEHWDGTSWSVVPTPNPQGAASTELQGVSGASSTDVWAVGQSKLQSGLGEILLLHWDGSAWTQVAAPQGTEPPMAVDAISTDDVWAVGSDTAEHWDGSAWATMQVPIPNRHTELLSVSGMSSSDVWATGEFPDKRGRPHSLVLHFDGTSWSKVSSPNTGPNSQLEGVTAVSSDNVWAVGNDAGPGDGAPRTLTEHWNGTSWSVVPGPRSIDPSQLDAVAAVSPTDVWAVGQADGPNGDDQTLAEQWNGATWTVSPTPQSTMTGTTSDFLGLAVTPGVVFAAGSVLPGDTQETLTLVESHAA